MKITDLEVNDKIVINQFPYKFKGLQHTTVNNKYGAYFKFNNIDFEKYFDSTKASIRNHEIKNNNGMYEW